MRRTTRFGAPIEGTMEIVEFDPLRAMGAKIRDGQTEMSGRATFTVEDQNRTRLTMHVELPGADPSRRRSSPRSCSGVPTRSSAS